MRRKLVSYKALWEESCFFYSVELADCGFLTKQVGKATTFMY